MTPEETWRVGRKVPRNLYRGDEPIAMLASEDLAQEIADGMNALEARDERSRELQQFHDEATKRAIEYDMKARVADKRIRELEQYEAFKNGAISFNALVADLEQQLQAAHERLAEAERLFASTLSCFKDTLSELRHTPEPCHPACRMCTRWMPDYDKAAQAAEEYFAKHSPEKTESG